MTASKKYSWLDLLKALRHRNSLAMYILGISSGLPYVLISGTLFAWFTKENISVATIGVFSWVIIIYSFKFLWSPAIDRAPTPGLFNMGQRRAGILLSQSIILACLLVISNVDPKTQLGVIAIVAVAATFTSSAQDILVAAWRIETADEKLTIDLLSAVEQFGYRTATILGGAGALIIAARIGWNNTFYGLSLLMGFVVSGVFLATDSKIAKRDIGAGDGAPPARYRNAALTPVIIGWAWSFAAIFGFMAYALRAPEQANARAFTLETGPIIVLVAIIGPALAAAAMLYLSRTNKTAPGADKPWPAQSVFDALYGAVLSPLVDIIDRLRYGAILVLLIALSYRFTDLIWGAFAYPFYLGDQYGALGHTLDEVAIASKLFGTLMTIAGIGIGGALVLRIGRMPCLVAGAILAAATNLLFADLALGGHATDAVMSATHAYALFGFVQPLADFVGLDVTANHAMAQLMMVIAAENLAVGFASTAIVVYLSSVVNPKFAAVQYALLGSLGFLLGSLGRGAIGEIIEIQGYAHVFYLTAAMGLVAVVLTSIEWVREARSEKTKTKDRSPA